MNLKKIIILPVGFFITNFLYIACCKCPPERHFYEVMNANVKPLGSGGIIIANGLPVTADTVYLNYTFSNTCIASAKPDFSFLVNAAYACKCNECGRGGLKSKLTSFQISSDNIFNGVVANQSLNSMFKVKDYFNPNISYSIDSLISAVNNGSHRLGYYSLFTKTKPGNTSGHKFKLTIGFANGSTVSVAANPIIWQ